MRVKAAETAFADANGEAACMDKPSYLNFDKSKDQWNTDIDYR
jgi:hypothetical protein